MRKPGPPPLPILIPDAVRPELEAMARSTTLAHALVVRARIVLAGAKGDSADFIASEIGCKARTVRKWKQRFRNSPKADALYDLPRSGRPAQVSVATRCKVIALACERPDEKLTPFRDTWTHKALAIATLALTGVKLSVSEIGRILNFNMLRPHLVRYWLTTKDANFGPKAERICDLYMNPPPGAVVYCVDEKPIQVLGRKYPMIVLRMAPFARNTSIFAVVPAACSLRFGPTTARSSRKSSTIELPKRLSLLSRSWRWSIRPAMSTSFGTTSTRTTTARTNAGRNSTRSTETAFISCTHRSTRLG